MSLKKKRCLNCDMFNDPEDTYCKNCGHNIEEELELESDSDIFGDNSKIGGHGSIYRIRRTDGYGVEARIESKAKELVYKTVESGTSEFIAVMGLTIIGIVVSGVLIDFLLGDMASSLVLLVDMVMLVYIIVVAWSFLPKITIYSQDSEKLGTIRIAFMLNFVKMFLQQKWHLRDTNGNILITVNTSISLTGELSIGDENFEFTPVKASKEEYYRGVKEFMITNKLGNKSFRLVSPKGLYEKKTRKSQAPKLFQVVTDNDIPLLQQIGTGLIIIKRYATESSTKEYQGV